MKKRIPKKDDAERSLVVHVDEVDEHDGLDLARELTEEELGRMLAVQPPTRFSAAGPAKLTARLLKVNERELFLDASFTAPARTECKRCLAEVKVPVAVKARLELLDRDRVQALAGGAAEDDEAGERGGSFALEEADEVHFSGDEIDLFPILQEQLLLALPTDALCREACKGLCQVCGQDLNERECGCDRHVPDPRWAGLKGLKLD